MTVLAIFNAKGGVAKTTSTVNLAACFAAMGQRVLVVDLDYQGNATRSFGFTELPRVGSYDLLSARMPAVEVRQDTFIPGLSLIGATDSLAAVDIDLALKDARHDLLRHLLAPLGEGDIVLLDCPPAMGVLTLNALVSCNAVLIPSPPEHFAHDGLLRTWALVTRIRDELNPGLSLLGILPTLLDPERPGPERAQADGGVLGLMRAEFGSRVARDGIPREDGLFGSAAAHGLPACVYEPEAHASQAYLALAAQILGREGPEAVSLHRLDDPAPDARALVKRGEQGLRHARQAAAELGLLAAPVNLPPTAPAPDPASDPLGLDPAPAVAAAEIAAPKAAALAFAVSAASLAVGFVAGWFAAISIP